MTEREPTHKERKGKGHKDMGGEIVSPAELLAPYDKPPFDPLRQGGLLTTATTTEAYVRPSYFRKNPEGLTKSDVKGIYMEDKPPEKLGFTEIDSGLEGEYFIFDDQGETVSAMNPGDPFRTALERFNATAQENGQEEIGYTVEMAANCVELTFDHGTDIKRRNRSYLGTLKSLVKIADETGVNIAPIANIPHRRLQPEEITDDPYTQKITFDVQGWDAAQHFDIASIQPHVEVLDHLAARKVINHLQHVSPILLGATLSGPFMDGRLEPNPEERYGTAPGVDGDPWKEATIENLEQGEHHSYRPKGRFFGSPSGGVLRQPIPEDEEEFLASIGAKLEKGEVPTAGREGGHHTDRYRVDIPPHGTLELCTLDPAGGKIERVVSMREFVRGLGWKMQMHIINGDFEQVQERYPALFGQEPSTESFEIAHHNSMRVAKHGADAILQGMDGEEHTTRELWTQLREFVQEPFIDEAHGIAYEGLPPRIIAEVSRAFLDPDKTMEKFKDAEGITSVKGFYETGIGNISHWMMQGAKDRIESGMEEKEAVMAVTVDVAKSFHEHIKSASEKDLDTLYKNPNGTFTINALPTDEAKTYWDKLLQKNLVPDAGEHLLQMGHPVELPSTLSEQIVAGAKATHDIILAKIKEQGGVTEWLKDAPVMFGPHVINDPEVNKQLDSRIDKGFGLPLEFDTLLSRKDGELHTPILEIHTAISYETVLADRLEAAGYDTTASNTRFGETSPADIYASFPELFAGGEPIVVMDTFPFDSTRPDKVGMQRLMGNPDSLPISPLDIIGKDENGYYYHPYIEDPEKPLDAKRDEQGKPIKDTSKTEYVKHAFARMAQYDLDVLWDTINANPDKEAAQEQGDLIAQFLRDSSVNWVWHPSWQHLGDKKMMPDVRKKMIEDANPLADQYVPVYGAGETVVESGKYIKKPTSAQHGVDQSRETVQQNDVVTVEEGYVYQGLITPLPVVSYVEGYLAEEMRRADQTTLRSIDRVAGNNLRPITGQLEIRALIPPYWRTDTEDTAGEIAGRYMTRFAPRWDRPEKELKLTQTNALGITTALHRHLDSTQDNENHVFYPYGMAPVVVYEA